MAAHPARPAAPAVPPNPVTASQRLAATVGVALLVVGGLGFIASASFATGDDLAGGSLIGFELNGWSNLLHLAAGAMLLVASAHRPSTRAAWRLVAFAALISLVAGLVDGDDVFGLVPVNGADSLADAALLVVAVVGARGAKERRGTLVRDRVLADEGPTEHVVGPGSGHVGGPRRHTARIDSRLS